MSEKPVQKISIDNQEYDFDSLNDTAKTQLGNVRMADQRISQLRADLALAQTARSVYAKILSENLTKDKTLPEDSSAS